MDQQEVAPEPLGTGLADNCSDSESLILGGARWYLPGPVHPQLSLWSKSPGIPRSLHRHMPKKYLGLFAVASNEALSLLRPSLVSMEILAALGSFAGLPGKGSFCYLFLALPFLKLGSHCQTAEIMPRGWLHTGKSACSTAALSSL